MRTTQLIKVIAITTFACFIGCDEGTPAEDSLPPTTDNSVPVTPEDSLPNGEGDLPPTTDDSPFVDDDNSGGEASTEGDLPAPDPSYPTEVVVNVQYEGAAVGNLLVTLFDSWPPTAPPSIFSDWPNANFPAMATLLDVPAGAWKLVVVLDVAPFNPAVQGPEDLITIVDILVPTEGTVMVTLEDNAPDNPDQNVGDESPEEEEETIVPPGPMGSLKFRKIIVDSNATGPAFGTTTDMNGDGKEDLVVAKFGQITGFSLPTGKVTVYTQGATLEDWTSFDIVTEADNIIWPNDISLVDIDKDGDLDALVPYGFLVCTAMPLGSPCGGLAWFEQSGSQWIRHDIVDSGSVLFYHKGLLTDLDGDGLNDLITVGEEKAGTFSGMDRAEAVWFKGNSTSARFEKTPRLIGEGLGSLPVLFDVDNDGDLDLASAEYFAEMGASFTWFEQVAKPSASNVTGTWARHVIDADHGPAIQLSIVEDFFGDGEPIGIGSNHTNTTQEEPDPWPSAVIAYRIPADPTQLWDATVLTDEIVSVPGSPTSPQAAPGVFGTGDIDGDLDHDLVVSGDGDPRIFLFEQVENEEFVIHVLDQDVGMSGGMVIEDLNGNGSAEILATSYDLDQVVLYVADEEGTYPLDILSAPGDGSNPVDQPEDVVDNPEPEEEPTNEGLFVSNGDPFEMGPLDVDMQNIAQGTAGAPTDMLVFSPSAPGTYAVVMFHHGFLMANQYYSEILTHVASHGFVVVAPQTYPPGGLPFGQPTTDEEAMIILSIVNWAQTGLAGLVNVDVDTELLALAGHSRGAKLSWILAQSQPELVAAVAAVDPVNGDGSGFATNEASALDQPLPTGIPSLVIGSGLSDVGLNLFSPACTPVGQNHVQFFELSGSPCWYMVATDAGHMDFLDASTPGCGMECTACTTGTSPEVTRVYSGGSLAAFFRAYLQGDDEGIQYLGNSSEYPTSWNLESK